MQVDGSGMQVVFTVNGPGEISGWLYPLAHALKALCPDISIAVCLLPCVYSTGAETSVLDWMPTIDVVCSVKQSIALITRNRLPTGMVRTKQTLVFHLGGEVALTVMLAKRLKAPIYAYTERPFPLQWMFRKVFYSGLHKLAQRISGNRPQVVGELMVDAAHLRRVSAHGTKDGRIMIALFPGSREYMAEFMLPYYAVIVDEFNSQRSDIDWVIAKADFVRMEFLRHLQMPPQERTWPARELRFGEAGNTQWLETPSGNRMRILAGKEVLSLADFALTIPGTNTGEIAASGIPMIVVVPTYLGHDVPLPGIGGHLGRIPVIGRMLKLAVGRSLLRSLPLLSQPNRRAGRMIVPEFVGQGLHPQIKAALTDLLASDTQDLRNAVRDAMGMAGAAQILASEIKAFFQTEPVTRQQP